MGAFVILLVYMLGLVSTGVILLNESDQRSTDRKRKTYRLTFPNDLSEQQVLAWIRAISGTLRPAHLFGGTPSLVFEVFAANHVITHRLRIPYGHEPYVLTQLRLIGVTATEEHQFQTRDWTRVVELGMTSRSRKLNVYKITDTANSVLANFQSVMPDQAMLLQWVVSPAKQRDRPIADKTQSDNPTWRAVTSGNMASADEVADRRSKLDERNFVGVVRIAARAKTDPASDNLIALVKSSLSGVEAAHTRFRRRWYFTKSQLLDRVDRAETAQSGPVQLSASEVAAVLGWPVDGPPIAGLAQSMTRPMPAASSIPYEGRVLGNSNVAGQERPVALAYNTAVRHMHITGPTGTGKSVLMANMMAQDMQQGYGVILIEAKKDLFLHALKIVPDHRVKDVVIIDLDDSEMPVGFNIMDQGNTRGAIDEIGIMIEQMFKEGSQSITAPQVLYNMMHALGEWNGSTFIDLPAMLSPSSPDEAAWRDAVVRNVKDEEVRRFMQNHLNTDRREQDRLTAPVRNRTWQFTTRPAIRHVFGQRTSSFQMRDVIANNMILLVNLNGDSPHVGKGAANTAGTLLFNAIWQTVRTLKPDKPNFLYLDEFQDFTNIGADMEHVLNKSRSANLGAVLAHQYSHQLSSSLRQSVTANTATKLAFQTVSDEARPLARDFSGRFKVTEQDLTSLPLHEAIAVIATDKGKSPPATLRTLAPPRENGNAKRVRELSRKKYGRPIAQVRENVKQRLAPETKPRKDNKPERGEGWAV